MKNYSKHKLTNSNDLLCYRDKMGVAEFWSYFDRLYSRVSKMEPGQSFEVDTVVRKENRDLFIKILCSFITDNPSHYIFNETYTVFYKLQAIEEFPAISFEKQLQEASKRI